MNDAGRIERLPPLRPLHVVALLALVALAVAGWREYWFLTDDAFITFRYIDHHHLRGWGYTWNPPPFAPVEGYSNFLWMVLLEGVWRVTGVEPPRACNPLSLAFGLGTLAVGFVMAYRAPLPARLAPARFWLAWLACLGAVVNRTFLMWMSSGLETSLFVLCVTAWVALALESGRRRTPALLASTCALASAAALTRPDGLLLVAASVAIAAWLAWRSGTARARRGMAAALAPLLAVAAHLAWRRSTYGEWVPNTYYAKHVAPWPESGVRYAASFALEYALWAPGLVALAALTRWRRRAPRDEGAPPEAPVVPVLVAATLLAHFAYYTLLIGGDHFEYRVYAQWVMLGLVGVVAALGRSAMAPRHALAALGLCVAASIPLPWVHHLETRGLTTRAETHVMVRPIAQAFPSFARPYVGAFDALQAWLIPHLVGVRHQEHKVFCEEQLRRYPTSWRSLRVGAGDPVLVERTVGVPGWSLPEVAIIDLFGLNDRVIARTPVPPSHGPRRMAHDRQPPPGYVECFVPNVLVRGGGFRVYQRREPLTPERIRFCERRFMPAR